MFLNVIWITVEKMSVERPFYPSPFSQSSYPIHVHRALMILNPHFCKIRKLRFGVLILLPTYCWIQPKDIWLACPLLKTDSSLVICCAQTLKPTKACKYGKITLAWGIISVQIVFLHLRFKPIMADLGPKCNRCSISCLCPAHNMKTVLTYKTTHCDHR